MRGGYYGDREADMELERGGTIDFLEDLNPGFGYGLPITAVRGGIKYPTPKKETHMPERQTKAQIQQELELNRSLIQQLRERQQDLLRAQKVALPAEPPSSYTMFTVDVRFTIRGKRYQFLILRSGGRYWTTGTGAEHQRFDSWEQLCQWLEGPTVYDHTNLEMLTGSGQVVDFNTGTIVAEDNQTPPY